MTASIAAATRKEGLDVKTIASGVGGWQYLDVVSKGAGKLEARRDPRRVPSPHSATARAMCPPFLEAFAPPASLSVSFSRVDPRGLYTGPHTTAFAM